MAEFGRTSSIRLASCHRDLQTLFRIVVQKRDCSVLEGYRGREKQEEAVRNGTSRLHFPKSKHNQNPSLAVDVVPYPVPDWEDIAAFRDFGNYVLGVADAINLPIEWGGHWTTLRDYPHFQLGEV